MRTESNSNHQEQQYINFMLAGEEYGVPILKVREIIRNQPLTRIPQSAPCVKGVLNLRGMVIPVFDLRERFGLPAGEYGAGARIIVSSFNGQSLGFIVDAVTEVLGIESDSIDPPPPIGAGIDQEFIEGMAKLENRLIILLDLDRVFNSAERAAFAEIAAVE